MEREEIDITGLDKAELLAALYNASHAQGLGFLQARDGEMTKEQAQNIIDGEGDDLRRTFGQDDPRRAPQLYFDYLYGRVLKVDLSGDSLGTWAYDRDNVKGQAARIVAEVRAKAEASKVAA